MKAHPATLALVIPLAAAALLAQAARPPTVSPSSAQGGGLEAVRAANDLLLKRQAETLKRLEELTLETRQLRIFTKRS